MTTFPETSPSPSAFASSTSDRSPFDPLPSPSSSSSTSNINMAYSNDSLRSRAGQPSFPQQFQSPPHSNPTSPSHAHAQFQPPPAIYTQQPSSLQPSMPYHSNHVQLSPYHGDVGINLEGGEGGMSTRPFQPAYASHTPYDRKAALASLQSYQLFMYALVGIAIVCLFTGFLSLGFGTGSYLALVMIICIGSFLFTLWLTQWIFSKEDGDAAMRRISEAIREGSEGFLNTQYTSIGIMTVILSVVIGIIYLFRDTPAHVDIAKPVFAIITALALIMGAFCSGLAGYVGVWVSVRVNIRVAHAASRFNYSDALLLAFRGGAVSACLSASFCILGIVALYLTCSVIFVNYLGMKPSLIPILLTGYGFGSSFVALVMQLGGGIYTKAADVGADMCGKIEAGIPEDDPRNPAVIADLVGDNVGDCAGSMADVFESIAAEVIGTMILGSTLASQAKIENAEPFVFFPLIVHAFDLVVSGVGIYLTQSRGDKEDALTTMKRSYSISMVCACVGFVATCRFMLYTDVAPAAWYHFAGCGMVGIVTSYLLILITQYYTDYMYDPVKRIAAASQTGHGTNVIAGVAVGMESTGGPVIVISLALMISYALGKTSGLPPVAAGVYGTAVATMGMLCTAVFVLSMNNFGPIADNAGGIVEMSGQPEQARVITDRLDSVGNVTKAASKGYAVGGSALACFVLFQAFLDEITEWTSVPFDTINVAKVEVVVGGMIGIMMIFVFTGWSMQAVGTTAQKVVWEVRRQFKNKPGIMDGTEKPDYGQCVSIVTKAALREMFAPAGLALCVPVAVGFTFRFIGSMTGRPMLGLEVIGGFMIFSTLAGLLMAIFLDNSGGAWDNAKKYIESQGKKGSEAHKAAVTGDTVGDPFKDTAGPSLHVIINTMSTTILVLGPVFISSVLPAR